LGFEKEKRFDADGAEKMLRISTAQVKSFNAEDAEDAETLGVWGSRATVDESEILRFA